MMKKFSMLLAMTIAVMSNAQKVDIDNYRVEMEVANMPQKFIDEDKRTFHVEIKGPKAMSTNIKKDELKLYGFKQVETDGTLKLVIDVSDMVRGTAGKSTRVVEQKDKDGKVTSKTNYYTYTSTNSANSYVTIYGPMSEKEAAEDLAKQKEKDAKKKEKEKPVAENPFLKNAANATAEAPKADDSSAKYKKIKQNDLGTSYTHSGSESSSATVAYDSYTQGASAAYNTHVDKYPSDVINATYTAVNTLYGYYPIKLTYQKMKILDSDKHPEHTTFKQATEAAKVIFKNFKYDSDIEAFRTDFAPILSYFSTLEAKLGNKEKADRKLKAAALYNIAMINFSLDNFDASEKACKEMIVMDQDKDDAEDIVKKIKEVKEELAKHKMVTRHIK
jgi:hypothetical protein